MIAAILNHAPALFPMLPLTMAALVALSPRPQLAWLGALAAALMLLLLACGATSYSPQDTVARYALGGWQPPLGIEYQLDQLALFMLRLLAVVAVLALLFARNAMPDYLSGRQLSLAYAALLLLLAGMMGMVVTHDAFNLYVFLEITSLATYCLVATGRDRRALSAAFQYLVLGTIGATFILIAIGFLYITTGSLNMTEIATRLATMPHSLPLLAAYGFMAVGLMLKMAIFPLHLWQPGAYAYAPSAITVLLAATATKVSVYVLLRVVFGMFGGSAWLAAEPLGTLLLICAVPAVLVGSLVALHETNLHRMLAFSSVSHMGYIAMGIGLATAAGLASSLVHLVNHALAKSALFMAVGCMAYGLRRAGVEEVNLATIRGLARQMPESCMGFVLAGLALVGLPLTAGFISKWQLFSAILQSPLSAGWVGLLMLVVVAGSVLALAYIWRVVELMYFAPSPHRKHAVEAPLAMRLPMWLAIAASFYFGLDTRWSLGEANQIALTLLEGGLR